MQIQALKNKFLFNVKILFNMRKIKKSIKLNAIKYIRISMTHTGLSTPAIRSSIGPTYQVPQAEEPGPYGPDGPISTTPCFASIIFSSRRQLSLPVSPLLGSIGSAS